MFDGCRNKQWREREPFMWEQAWHGHRILITYLESRWQCVAVRHPKSTAKLPCSSLMSCITVLPFSYLWSGDNTVIASLGCLLGRLSELIMYVKCSELYLTHGSSIARDHRKKINLDPKIFFSSPFHHLYPCESGSTTAITSDTLALKPAYTYKHQNMRM